MKFGKRGPAERDSTGRTDFKQKVTKLLEEQEVPQGASNGPQARLMAEAALIIKKISPLYLFAFEKAFKYISAEFAPIVQSRIFKSLFPNFRGPSLPPHVLPVLDSQLQVMSFCLSFLSLVVPGLSCSMWSLVA